MVNDFFQQGPKLENQYAEDRILKSYLRRVLPESTLKEIESDLLHMGERAATDLIDLAESAEKNRPKHIPFDSWGTRIDKIETSPEWKALDRISAEEKLIAIGYERKQGVYSRIYQFAKLYLFHPSSAMYTCPLAMTDGAARVIELYGDDLMKASVYPHLISSDPDFFWTSGQWMTEKTGGSDVATTSTTANARLRYGEYELFGTKWFTSATTSQIALTLARTDTAQSGGKHLSLFYIKLKDSAEKLNNIRVRRLKDKLGTWALPTAELELTGTPATLIGGEGDGIKKISALFNITRIYNACCAIGNMRRALALTQNYAVKRIAFGRPLNEQSLHVETLSDLQVEFEACFQLTFKTVELLGKDELGQTSPGEHALLRLLTPIAKLYTAKKAISLTSEVLESFGGAGYIEDTGLPKLLRDSQVLSIWEGTTNVLSLDVLRALDKENAGPPFFEDVKNRLSKISTPELKNFVRIAEDATHETESFFHSLSSIEPEDQQAAARHFSMTLAKLYSTSLLIEQADWALRVEKDRRPTLVLSRWCERHLVELISSSKSRREDSRKIFF